MNKWSFCRVVFIVFFLAVDTAQSATSLSDNAKAALYTDIEFNGTSSIIVEYDNSNSASLLPGQSTEALVQSMHKSFIGSLTQGTANNVSGSFSYMPGMVLSVDKKQLQEVLSNPFVKRVYQNKARRISLQESLGIVLPGRSKELHSGKGQVVAILDTGVDSSHDFFKSNGQSRVVSEACYSGGGFSGFRQIALTCPNRSRVQIGAGAGKDCTNLNISGCDHGTHVAGIAAGNDGVANEAGIIAIQIFTGLRDVFNDDICGTGVGQSCVVAFDSDIIKGLERVYSLRNTYNIAAVNMSLGGGEFTASCDSENSIMTSVIGKLKDAGIATVVASGNNGFSDAVNFPGCISNAVTVGATSDFSGEAFGRSFIRDGRTFYSNHSATVDLFAPGTLIRSSVPGNGFANFNGTSMAAPHVAAGFAVVKAEDNSLTVNEIENTFKAVGPSVVHSGISRRRINIASALRRLGLSKANISVANIMLLLDESTTTDAEPETEIASPAGCDLPAIGLGQTKNGLWTSSSPISKNRSPSRSEPFVFELTEPKTVTITLNSNADTYLYLMRGCSASGSFITSNDDFNGLNSRIRRSLDAGVYTIDATTYGNVINESFTLKLDD